MLPEFRKRKTATANGKMENGKLSFETWSKVVSNIDSIAPGYSKIFKF
jgi:hypothetical protein